MQSISFAVYNIEYSKFKFLENVTSVAYTCTFIIFCEILQAQISEDSR